MPGQEVAPGREQAMEGEDEFYAAAGGAEDAEQGVGQCLRVKDVHAFLFQQSPQFHEIPHIRSLGLDPVQGNSGCPVGIGKLSLVAVDEDRLEGERILALEDVQGEHLGPAPVKATYEECDFHRFFRWRSRHIRVGDRFVRRIFLAAPAVAWKADRGNTSFSRRVLRMALRSG